MTEEKTYSAKQLARRIGTDPKTIRKFFRSNAWPEDAVGQGGRYEYPESRLPEIDASFHEWHDRKAKPTSTPKVNGTKPPISDEELAAKKFTKPELDMLVETVNELALKELEGEPTAEELLELEDLDLEDEDDADLPPW